MEAYHIRLNLLRSICGGLANFNSVLRDFESLLTPALRAFHKDGDRECLIFDDNFHFISRYISSNQVFQPMFQPTIEFDSFKVLELQLCGCEMGAARFHRRNSSSEKSVIQASRGSVRTRDWDFQLHIVYPQFKRGRMYEVETHDIIEQRYMVSKYMCFHTLKRYRNGE
jgi:hypothetical protein